MKLQHNKLWLAIGLGVLSGPALAAITCTLTPAHSVVYVGQSVLLTATCGAGLTKIQWNEGTTPATPVTESVSVDASDAGTPLSYSYPATAAGTFSFSVTGTPQVDAVKSKPATVLVLPAAGVVAGGASAGLGGTAPTSFDAACGSANNRLLENAPTAAEQCDLAKGQPALFVTGPSQFSWSCISRTGGAEDNCYATRSVFYMVTTSSTGGTGGSISPSSKVAAGTSETVTATPPAGWNTTWGGTCGGTSGGSNTSYTTNAVTGPCTVTASFSSAPAAINGACGASNGQTLSSAPTSGLCSAGTPSGVTTGSTSYTWNCAGLYGGSTTNPPCSATISTPPPSSSGDPGGGLWVPPGIPNRTVADQSGGATDRVSYVPGCLNGGKASSSSFGCAAKTSFDGTLSDTGAAHTVAFGGDAKGTAGSGKQLLLRYQTGSVVNDDKSIRTLSSDGGNVLVKMRVWLSTDPRATYASVSQHCKAEATTTPTIRTASQEQIVVSVKNAWGLPITVTTDYCKLAPNTTYYYGMEYDEPGARRFQVEEAFADFK